MHGLNVRIPVMENARLMRFDTRIARSTHVKISSSFTMLMKWRRCHVEQRLCKISNSFAELPMSVSDREPALSTPQQCCGEAASVLS